MSSGQSPLRPDAVIKAPLSIQNLSRTAGILAVLLLIYAAVATWHSWNDVQAEYVNNLTTVTELEAQAIDKYFKDLENNLRGLGEDLTEKGDKIDLDRAYVLVKKFKERHSELYNVTLIQPDGAVLLTAKAPPGSTRTSLAGEASFIAFINELKQGKVLGIGQPLVGVVSKVVIVPVRYAIKDRQGNLSYIVSANLPHEHLRSFWMDAPVAGKAAIGLMRDNGFLLSRYPVPSTQTLNDIYGKPRTGALINHLQTTKFPEHGYVQGASSLDGPNFLNVFRRLPNYPVTLFVVMPMSELRESWLKRVSSTYLAIFFLFLGGFAAYRYALRRQYAWDVEQKRLEEELQDSEKTYRAIIDGSPVPSAVNDTHGNITYLNVAFTHLFGYTLTDIPTLEQWWPQAFPDPEYREWVATTWQARLETSLRNCLPFEPMEVKVRAQNGEVRTVLVTASPLDSSLDGQHLVTLYDITGRKSMEDALKQGELALRASEEQMAASQQIGRTGSWVYDIATNRIRASTHSLTLFGFPSGDGDHSLDDFLACIEDRERVSRILATAITEGKAYDDEFVMNPADGSPPRIIHSIGRLERDVQGNPLRMIGFIQDTTERKQAEQAILESETRFRILADTAPVLIWISGKDKLYNWFNKVWLDFTGRRMEQEVGNGWTEQIHPEDLARCIGAYEAAFDARKKFSMEYRLRRFDGEYRWLVDNGVPRFDEQAAFLGYVGSCIDITERKQVQEVLDEKLRLLSTVLDNSSVGITFVRDRKQVWANRHMGEMFGYTLAEMENQSTRMFFPSQEAYEDLGRSGYGALSRGEHFTTELEIRRKDESLVWSRLSGKAIDAGNSALGSIWVFEDISEQKRGQKALETAKEAAEAASVAKSRFLATMSHEIRTPMNGILGMAQMLLIPTLRDVERLDYARIILNSGQTLLALLNDILDVSKVESGKLELESAALEPGQILHETQALFAEAAIHKGLSIESTWIGAMGLPDQPFQRYLGDPHRLRQMLSNLVSNALKFTAKGHIRIEARELERDGSHATLEFSVTDTGIGIPQEKQALLFTPFSQADSSTTREYGGSGLGLSIVRSLATLMGGNVGIDSTPGAGSRFWFRIRAELLAAGTDSREEPRQEKVDAGDTAMDVRSSTFSGHILVVDDNLTNRIVLKAMLNKPGVHCDFVEDGQQAVDAITGGMNPDLVLMDCQMPVMDGYEATRRIRLWETENIHPHLTIVALTASAFEEDRKRCLEVGMDDFLVKPIDIEKLTATLGRWLANDVSRAAERVSGISAVIAPQEDGPPIFDAKTLVAQLGGDRNLAKTVVLSAMSDIPDYFDQLEQAMAAGNWKDAERQTHTLKGLTAQIGGMRFMLRVKAVDDHLKNGGKTDDATVTDLRREYQLLSDTAERWMASLATTTPGPLDQRLAIEQIVAICCELDTLLSQNKFDAVGRFKALQELVAATDVPAEVLAEITEAGKMLRDFRFDLAREHLHQIAAQQGWEAKTP